MCVITKAISSRPFALYLVRELWLSPYSIYSQLKSLPIFGLFQSGTSKDSFVGTEDWEI